MEMQGLYFGMGIDTSQLHSDFINAEKTINQNLRRINQEMEMIQLRGQLELEGLDESASQLEKVRIQEEALSEQMKLQQDKILLLNKAYEYLVQTRGKNAEASRQLELQLAREQHAMQKLETQMEDLENQTKIAFGMNFEMLTLIEPIFKKIEERAAAGLALPLALAPAQAKAAAAGLVALTSAIAGTKEATEELREENPAQLVDEDLRRLSGSIDNSWQKINENNRRGMEQMRSYNNGYYKNNYYSGRNRDLQNYNKATQEQVEQIKENTQAISEAKEEQDSVIENFLTETLGIKKLEDGGLKILPKANRDDLIRFSKVFEDYRFSESLTNAIDLIKGSDSVIGKLASTIISFTYLTRKAREPIVEFAQEVIDNFRELSKVADELNLPIDRANDLMSTINLTGADYNDVRDYVRGVQDAVIKGDSEDPEVLALEKYGVVIQDTNGKLIAFDETLERLYQGYLKAKEEGEAEGYVMMTNGQAVQDVLPYFEKLAQAKEDVAKIKWATLDAATFENVSHEMRLLEIQTGELKSALGSLAAPAAEMALKKMFEELKGYTELIEENRDTVIYWSYVLMEAMNSWDEFTSNMGDAAKEKLKSLAEELKPLFEEIKNYFSEEPPKDIAEEAKENLIPLYKELKKLEEEFGLISKIKDFLPEGFTEKLDSALNEYLVPFYEKLKSIEEEFSITNKLKNTLSDLLPEGFVDGMDSIFARAQKDFEEYKKANEEARKEAEETEKYLAGLSYSLNRIAKYKEELANLNLDIKFGSDDSYQKRIEQNKIWYETALKDAKQYANEIAIIEEVNAAKLQLIEQERADKIAEIRERVEAGDKTALQNKLDTIEKERQAWTKAGMDELESVELAQKQIAKVYEEVNARIQEHIKNAADMEYEMTHTAFEKQIRDIEQWEEAQRQKADTAEEVQSIISESAMKEAQAFEREMERIKGTLQSLEDKVFEQEHSQYENDLRRAQQERIKLYEDFQSKGILDTRTQALIERYYQNSVGKINQRARESKGGDYTKAPKGFNGGGVGTGIMMINGDQIIGGKLINAQQEQIGLLTDENRLRAQLSQKLDADAQAALARIQATKESIATQKASQQEVGFQLIEGAKVANQPLGVQTQSVLPTTELLKFGEAVQQSTAEIEQVDPSQVLTEPMRAAAEAQKAFAESVQSFPPEYFKNLADSAQSVSEMQLRLTESTLSLIDAQGKLEQSLKTNSSVEAPKNNQTPEGFMQLSKSTQDVQRAQESLSHTARETNNNLKELSQSSYGIGNKKIGFDWDAFSGIAQTGLSALSVLSTLGGMAPIPIIKAGSLILGAATGAGFALGGTGQDLEPRRYADNQQGLMPAEIDLSTLTTPLSSIDTNVQSIAQAVQDSYSQENDRLQELFGTLTTSIEETVRSILAESQGEQSQEDSDLTTLLSGVPKIGEDVQGILQGIQTKENTSEPMDYLTPLSSIDMNIQSIAQAVQVPMTFETVVTPLNNISTVVENILTALNNRQPPQVIISPNNSINLGGAYVFDNAMKQELVNDITSQIVDNITSAVQAATSSSNYGYGA